MRLRNIPAARPAVEQSPYCIQNPTEWKGRYGELFGNDNPIHIEIGMGKGKFLITQALLHPEVNYLGLERYESVMYRAVLTLEEQELPNLRLICCDAAEIPTFFSEGEVEQIYLNFSDPWPKARHAKRRLTSRRFLSAYEQVLINGGIVEFKTDNEDLFRFSEEEMTEAPRWEIIDITEDLHGLPQSHPLLAGNVMTEYEEKFVAEGKPIHKMVAIFQRPE